MKSKRDNTTDETLSVLDQIINAVESAAEPFLTSPEQAAEFAGDIIQHLNTHLRAELDYIAGGDGDGFSTEQSFVHELRVKHETRRLEAVETLTGDLEEEDDELETELAQDADRKEG